MRRSKRRTLGPLPLNGGVDLDPASARPNTLLDALNMEERDGELRTRAGHNMLKYRSDDSAMRDSLYPAAWSGESVGYALIDIDDTLGSGADPVDVGELFYLSLYAHLTAETDFTLDYYNVNTSAWETFRTVSHPTEPQGYGIGTALLRYFAVRPEGFEAADPVAAGSPYDEYAWIRITLADSTFSANLTGACGSKRSFEWLGQITAKTRAGWDTFLAWVDPDTSPAKINVGTTQVSDALLGTATQLQYFNTPITVEGPLLGITKEQFSGVYCPAVNYFYYNFAGEWWKLDASESVNLQTTAVYQTEWEPDHLGTDTDWEDVQLRSAVPHPTAVAMFAGRMFVAEKDTGQIWWSAPDEFVDLWPEGNTYRLGSRGAASVVAMEELHGILYLFTESEIWAASMGEPIPGQDSQVSFHLVEQIGTVSRGSVVGAEDFIFFLAQDGVRIFDGQQSKVLTANVEGLFRIDSEHSLAIRGGQGSTGVFNHAERRYELYYRTSDSLTNNGALFVDLDTGACWVHGSDRSASLDASGASGPSGQRHVGLRGHLAVWRPDMGKVLGLAKEGYIWVGDTGIHDCGQPIPWRAESHHIGLGAPGRRRLRRIEATVERDTFGSVKLSGIADGRRVDSRTASVQRDGIGTSQALGSADAAGESMVGDVDAYAPVIWRGGLVGRNHRIRLESVGDDHVPLRLASLTVEMEG